MLKVPDVYSPKLVFQNARKEELVKGPQLKQSITICVFMRAWGRRHLVSGQSKKNGVKQTRSSILTFSTAVGNSSKV